MATPYDEGFNAMVWEPSFGEPTDSLEAEPSFAPDEFAEEPVEPSGTSSAPQFDAQDAFRPTTISGGLDQYYYSRRTQIDKLMKEAAEHPIFRNSQTGEISPYPTGLPFGISPEGQQIVNSDYVPLQEQKARSLDAEISSSGFFRDVDVFKNAPIIYNALKKSVGGQLTAENFVSAPYWENIRQQGVSDDYINALQKSVVRFVAPLWKEDNRQTAIFQDLQDSAKDPLTALFMPGKLADKSYAISTKGVTDLRIAKDKAEALKNDSVLFQDFQQIIQDAENKDPDARRWMMRVRGARSADAMASTISAYAVDRKNRQQAKDSMLDQLSSDFSGLVGDSVDVARGAIEQAIHAGEIGNKSKLSMILRALRSASFDESKPTGVVVGGIELPSIAKPMAELRITKAIDRAVENGQDINKMVITADGRLHDADKIDSIVEADIKARFGVTNADSKMQGDWTRLPKDFFSLAGNTVFLQAINANGVQVPASITYGDWQFVPNQLLRKMGISTDQIKSAVSQQEKLNVSDRQKGFVTNASVPYQPTAIPANVWLQSPEGQRLGMQKQFMQAVEQHHTNYGKLLQNSENTTKAITNPSALGEFTKAAVRGVFDTLVSAPMAFGTAVGDTIRRTLPGKMLSNALTGVFSAMMRDFESAKKDWEAVKQLGENRFDDDTKGMSLSVPSGEGVLAPFKGIGKTFEEWSAFGQNLLGTKADPTAGKVAKAAAFTAEIGVGMFSFVGKMGMAQKVLPFIPLAEKTATAGVGLITGWTKALEAEKAAVKFAASSAQAFERMQNVAALQRKIDISKHIIGSALGFAGVGVIEGKHTPEDYATMAATGALFGAASGVGRGMRAPVGMQIPLRNTPEGQVKLRNLFRVNPTETTIYERAADGSLLSKVIQTRDLPWYPSKSRVVAASAGGGLVYGMDVYHQWAQGKSGAELLQSLSDPDTYANVLMMTGFMLIGQRDTRMTPPKDRKLPGHAPGSPPPPDSLARIPPAQPEFTVLPRPQLVHGRSDVVIDISPAALATPRPLLGDRKLLENRRASDDTQVQAIELAASTAEKQAAIDLHAQGAKKPDGTPLVTDAEAAAAKANLGKVAPLIEKHATPEIVEKERQAAEEAARATKPVEKADASPKAPQAEAATPPQAQQPAKEPTLAEALRDLDSVAVVVPKGATHLRVKTPEGKTSVVAVADLKKDNPLRGVELAEITPVAKNKSGGFVAVSGDVSLKKPATKRISAIPSAQRTAPPIQSPQTPEPVAKVAAKPTPSALPSAPSRSTEVVRAATQAFRDVGTDFKVWGNEMQRQFGESIAPKLKDIYKKAKAEIISQEPDVWKPVFASKTFVRKGKVMPSGAQAKKEARMFEERITLDQSPKQNYVRDDNGEKVMLNNVRAQGEPGFGRREILDLSSESQRAARDIGEEAERLQAKKPEGSDLIPYEVDIRHQGVGRITVRVLERTDAPKSSVAEKALDAYQEYIRGKEEEFQRQAQPKSPDQEAIENELQERATQYLKAVKSIPDAALVKAVQGSSVRTPEQNTLERLLSQLHRNLPKNKIPGLIKDVYETADALRRSELKEQAENDMLNPEALKPWKESKLKEHKDFVKEVEDILERKKDEAKADRAQEKIEDLDKEAKELGCDL